jgi:hypothetical protein
MTVGKNNCMASTVWVEGGAGRTASVAGGASAGVMGRISGVSVGAGLVVAVGMLTDRVVVGNGVSVGMGAHATIVSNTRDK